MYTVFQKSDVAYIFFQITQSVKDEPILIIFGRESRRNFTSEIYEFVHLACKV